MATRNQQDAFMDDSDDSCPLCVEEFDISDKNFKPCPCGYQVCQFCYNNIKTNMNGLCPACRRPYDDKNIQWKIISPEEAKADIAAQAKKKAFARQKETERRQVETLNRRHLAGLRVVQKNLVYVVGLNPKSREEDLLQTLRGDQYFGQYGKIIKIVVSKAKEGASNNSIGVYVTFARKQDAASCIAAVDGSQNGDRVLRAQYGTTKYCSAYLRNEICNNRQCMFLHETNEDHDSFSREDLSSMNAVSTQRSAQSSSSAAAKITQQPPQPQPPPQKAPQNVSAASQSMARQGSLDEAMSRSDSGDGSALPSTASWGKQAVQAEGRRSSKPASVSAPSPVVANASLSSQSVSAQPVTTQTSTQVQAPQPWQADAPATLATVSPAAPIEQPAAASNAVSEEYVSPSSRALERAMKKVMESSYKFVFDQSPFSDVELKELDSYPLLFDPNGGLIRYRMEKEREQARLKQEEERNALKALSISGEDENPASGSLQLGGEPETQDDQNQTSGRGSSEPRSAIQPPITGSGLLSNSPLSASNLFGHNPINPLLTGRSFTPQVQQQVQQQLQQQLQQLRPNTNQQNVFTSQPQQGYSGHTSMHHHQQSNPFQNQSFGSIPGHARQASRFAFANESSTSTAAIIKPTGIPQQSGMLPSSQPKQFQSQSFHQANAPIQPFYSGVQGPPPGLKSSGTPPVSGGGMFGQGHGFTSAMGGNLGLGNISGASKDTNEELMRELLRGRNGNLNGHGHGHDSGKREFKFPSVLPSATSDTAPASSLLNSLYGSQLGSLNGYQEHNLQRQKKKGKKHRHANTSSSGGGGLVNLADPSILQARMHHGGAGQGQYGVQGQGSRILSHFQTATPFDGGSGKGRAADVTEPASAAKSSAKDQPRTHTPVPSGLQDFPPLVAPQPRPAPPKRTTTSTIAAIKPVVPVVPTPLNRIASNIKDVQSTQAVSETQGAAKSDKPPKSLEPVADIAPAEVSAAADPKVDPPKASASAPKGGTDVNNDPLPAVTSNKAGKAVEKRQAPAKIDVSAAKNATGVDPSKSAKAVSKNQKLSDPSTTTQQAVLSRPSKGQSNTPTESIGKSSPISEGRSTQPRTLKVVPTSHAEITLKVGSASPSVPETPSVVNKPLSRRPSLTSIHAPGTPMSEKISENASVTSTSMSRANSPPPSKVGTAPIRHISKSQQKKERQARAKQAEDATKSEAAPVKSIAEESEIAPIIGRKKKTKKPKNNTDTTPAVTRPTSPVQADEAIEEKESQPATPLKASKDVKRKETPMTERSIEPESPATPEVVSSNSEQAKASLTGVSILASLQRAGELTATVQELFKGVPGLNQRFDLPANAFPHSPSLPPLSEAQRALLDQGIPVHIEFKHNKRMIVLPDRTTLSHLSKEQAQRYVALHRSITLTSEHFADIFFTASRQNSKVLQMHPPRKISKNPEDGQTLANRFGSPPALDQTPAGHPILPAMYPTDDKLGPQRPIMEVQDAERVLMATRKETEAMEKKLNALMRKNRRMMFGGH